MLASRSRPSRPSTPRRRSARPPRSRSTTSHCAACCRSMRHSHATHRSSTKSFAAYVKTVDGGGHGNVVFESRRCRGRRRPRIRAMRCDRRGNVGDTGAASRLPGDQRLRRGRRRERPHHAVCELPVGAPRAAARRRGARRADGADSGDRDSRRRRIRRQARVEPPLDRRVARARRAPPGEARAVADAGLRDPALAPPGAHLDEDRRAARRHDTRARRAHRRSTAARTPTKARRCWRSRC